jgi:predicted MFS family arabinose efflux permease
MGIFPLMLIYAVGFMSATYLPVWVGAAAREYGVQTSTVGLIGSYELGAIAISTIISAAFRSPTTSRLPLLAGLIVSIVFNGVAAFASTLGIFTIMLIVAGLANGFLLAEVNGRAAACAVPARVFTGQLFVMMSCATLFFAAAPRLLSAFGAGAPFLFCAAAGVFALMSLAKMTSQGNGRADRGAGESFSINLPSALLLVSPTLLFISMNVLWPYISPEATRAGVTLAQYSKALSAGALINLIGPLISARFLRRQAAWASTMSIGIIALAICTAMATTVDNSVAFLVGITFIPFFLLIVIPFYLAMLTESDPSGKFVAVSSAFFMIGTAVGPGLGGLSMKALGLPGLAFASIGAPMIALLTSWSASVILSNKRAKHPVGGASV